MSALCQKWSIFNTFYVSHFKYDFTTVNDVTMLLIKRYVAIFNLKTILYLVINKCNKNNS